VSEKLAKILLQSQAVTEAQLGAARADAAQRRKRLPETLIDLGFIDERRFAEIIARASATQLVDPLPEAAAAAVQHRITRAIARDLGVVPLRLEQEQLFVAMVSPVDEAAIDVLRATTGFGIRPVTGIRSAIERLVRRFYPDDYDVPDTTVLPPSVNFEAGSEGPLREAASPAIEREPFDMGNTTFRSNRHGPAPLREPLEDEPFPTMMVKPDAHTGGRPLEMSRPLAPLDEALSTAPTDPLIAIKRRLDQLAKMMKKMQKQLDDIDALLSQAVNR
jgi:Type II secretion system (T2SS), protein E, N-terminal domain